LEDKDAFAVWLAGAILRANADDISAAALSGMANKAKSKSDFDLAIKGATTTSKRRPGDFGLEVIGPLIPVLLVEFGRLLWDAYVKALAQEGGKALASVTLKAVKELAKRTWSAKPADVSLPDAEATLRTVALSAGLNSAQAQKLIENLHKPTVADELAAK
jgi:hypothetical protein